MEYAAKFNEFSRFAPNQVTTEEMRMDHFEQSLKGPIKRMIVGHVFSNFQEMYQRVVKIARVIEKTKAESRQMCLAKRRFSPGGSRTQENKRFKKFNTKKGRARETSYAGERNEALQLVWLYTFWAV